MNASPKGRTNAAGRLSGLQQAWSTFWNQRNQRERSMLISAAVVVALGLFYALFIDPALSGRKDLEKKLPALRQQAAEVQALSKEAAAMGNKVAVPAPVLTRESIEASLSRKELKPQSVLLTNELVKVQLAAVSFSSLVEWLAEMQRTVRLTVIESNIESLAQPDQVNATLTLQQQRSE